MPLTPDNQQAFYIMIGELFEDFNKSLHDDHDHTVKMVPRLRTIAANVKKILDRFDVPFLLLFPRERPGEYWLAFARLRSMPDVIKPISEKVFWKEFPRCFSLLKQSFETSLTQNDAAKDPILLQDREPLKNLLYSSPFEMILAIIKEDNMVHAFIHTRHSVNCITRSLLEGLLSPKDIEFLNTLPPIQEPPHDS